MSNLHFGLVNSALWPLGHLGQPPWETESRAQDVLSQQRLATPWPAAPEPLRGL